MICKIPSSNGLWRHNIKPFACTFGTPPPIAPPFVLALVLYRLSHIEGILPKGPYLPCASMAGRALLAGYPRWQIGPFWQDTLDILLCLRLLVYSAVIWKSHTFMCKKITEYCFTLTWWNVYVCFKTSRWWMSSAPWVHTEVNSSQNTLWTFTSHSNRCHKWRLSGCFLYFSLFGSVCLCLVMGCAPRQS